MKQFIISNKRFLILKSLLCILSWGLSVYPVFAQPVSSNDLINDAKQYDGKTVVYEGEVIGDIMKRGDHAWANILEGPNAMGVWIERGLLKDVAFTGGYKSIGDRVEITGVFHRACPEHGGDMDIHAQSLRLMSIGRFVTEKLDTRKKGQALLLLGILVFVWILNLFIRK